MCKTVQMENWKDNWNMKNRSYSSYQSKKNKSARMPRLIFMAYDPLSLHKKKSWREKKGVGWKQMQC